MLRDELSDAGRYKEYCDATDKQWEKILRTKNLDDFVRENHVYQQIVNKYKKTT